MFFSVQNKLELSNQWIRIRCQIDFYSYKSGVAALISDEDQSKTWFENGEIPYKNFRNELIFGDFFQNKGGFIGFIYQVQVYNDFNLALPQFKILDCNLDFSENLCVDWNQEKCIDDICNQSTKNKRYLNYVEVNNTQIDVTYCPTYYFSDGNQCVWNSSVLEFSFYNSMQTYTDLSGNVQLSQYPALPVFQQSRGLYFNGVDSGFLVTGMILSPDVTVIFWFNPDQSTGRLTLVTKVSSFGIGIDSMKPFIYLTGLYSNSNLQLSNGTWYQGVFTVIAGNSPIATIIINRVQTLIASIPYSKIITNDQGSNNLSIGRSSNGRFFLGWIVYFFYAPYHTAFASLTFTIYSQSQLYMCDISNYYNGSDCQFCFSEGVLECSGPFYNNALSCAQSMTLCNNICFCNDTFYWNGTMCLPCYSSCSFCNGPLSSNCLLNSNSQNCITGYFYKSDTCESVTYEGCFGCDATCLSCSGPSLSDCTNCIQTATLVEGGSCMCSQGWSGSPPLCDRIYFEAILSLNASNVVSIHFSEPLSQQLPYSNISVFINNLTQTFVITMADSFTYLLEILFMKNITQNSSLQVSIQGVIVSKTNSLLSPSNFYETLHFPNCLLEQPWPSNTICIGCSDSNAYLLDSECFCKDLYIKNQTVCEYCTKVYDNTTKSCYCPNLCTDCIGNKCTFCVENAHLQDDKCLCNISFYGTTACLYSNFTLIVTLTFDNSLILSFYEDPLTALNQADINLFISNIIDFSFTLIEYSVSSYLINITYNEKIETNCTLQLVFKNPIYSIYNGNLTTLKYDFMLNPTVLSYEAVVSYQSEQTSTTVSQTLTIASFSLSAFNWNFVTLWSFLNTIQLICFIRLSTISLTPKFDGQLKGLKKFNMFPNVFGYLLNESDYTINERQFVNFGYKSSQIFFNCGNMITIGLVLFAFLLVCLLAKFLLFIIPFKLVSLRTKVDSLIQSFKYGRFIRYLIQAYLDILASAFISLILFKTDTTMDIVNLSFSILLLIILAGVPILFVKITKQKNENNDNGIMSLYGTLFSEFSNTENLSSSLFYVFFFLRRMLYIVIILFIPNIGLLKLTLNLIVFLSVIIT